MGFFNTIKKAFTEKGAVGQAAEKTGEVIGRGAGTVYQKVKSVYQKKYGAEGRAERIKQYHEKEKELRAYRHFQEEKAKVSKVRGESFQNRFGGMVTEKKKDPLEAPNLGGSGFGGTNLVDANKLKRKIL